MKTNYIEFTLIGDDNGHTKSHIISGLNSTELVFKLNLGDRHEESYYQSLLGGKKVLDHIVAESLIKPGDVVVDVGANIGFCAIVYLMSGAETVISFEPHPDIFKRLYELSSTRITTVNSALTNTHGDAELLTSTKHNQGHTLSAEMVEYTPSVFSNGQRIPIKQSPLDFVWNGGPIDFLKVDIEGGEGEFIDGAKMVLSKHAPRVLHIELYPIAYDHVVPKLTEFYSHIYRCVIMMREQELKLISPNVPIDSVKGVDPNHPPTYICVNDLDSVRHLLMG